MKNILRERREDLRLTLQQVADYVGVSSGTVSRWETGNIKNMKRDKIAKLSEILQVSPSTITGWETVKIETPKGNITDFIITSNELELIKTVRKMSDKELSILEAYIEVLKRSDNEN